MTVAFLTISEEFTILQKSESFLKFSNACASLKNCLKEIKENIHHVTDSENNNVCSSRITKRKRSFLFNVWPVQLVREVKS